MSFKDKENTQIKVIIEKQNTLHVLKSEFLKITFCVYIHDNIFDVLALHKLAETIKEQYGKEYRNNV